GPGASNAAQPRGRHEAGRRRSWPRGWAASVVAVDGPGVAGVQQLSQTALTLSSDSGIDLLVEQLVVGRTIDTAEDTDRDMGERRLIQPRQRERHRRVGVVRVMHQDLTVGDLGAGHDLHPARRREPYRLLDR